MTIKEKIRKKTLAAGDAFIIDWPEGTEGFRTTTWVYVYHIVKGQVNYPIKVIEVRSYRDAMFNSYSYEVAGLKFAHNIPASIVKANFFNAVFSNKFAKYSLEYCS